MPFGALQTLAIIIGCYCAQKFRIKSAIFAFLMLLVSQTVRSRLTVGCRWMRHALHSSRGF